MADVSRDWGDAVLVLCYLITGLLDSTAISHWNSFVSMQTGKLVIHISFRDDPAQAPASSPHKWTRTLTELTRTQTGNTVFLGLGLADPYQSNRWIKSGVSLFSFCLGSFFFSRFHRFFSPTRRWVLCVSFTAQCALTAAAARLVSATVGAAASSQDDVGWQVLVPIALVAFQSCGQAVTSRALKYHALNSVVLTSMYCDLFSDPDLFALRNADRNRMAVAPLALLVGAFLGGIFQRTFGVAGTLWAVALLKSLVVLLWLVWPAEAGSEDDFC